MPWGQITGVRAMQWLQAVRSFLKAEPGRMFTAEHMSKITGEEFKKVVQDLDKATAQEMNSRWRMEHTDAYCFLRDYRYGRRSRRWLMARAEDTRLEGTSELWGTYVRVNHVINPNADEIYSQNAEWTAEQPFADFMDPK